MKKLKLDTLKKVKTTIRRLVQSHKRPARVALLFVVIFIAGIAGVLHGRWYAQDRFIETTLTANDTSDVLSDVGPSLDSITVPIREGIEILNTNFLLKNSGELIVDNVSNEQVVITIRPLDRVQGFEDTVVIEADTDFAVRLHDSGKYSMTVESVISGQSTIVDFTVAPLISE